jgi:hypothetical protein
MTEWYPSADVTPVLIKGTMLAKPDFAGEIAWKQVKVLPRAAADFPTDASRNHYYAARETDAAPVQVGAQREKFLFYRGVANFAPPLQAMILSNGRISVKAQDGQTVGDVVLYENRGGLTAHARHHSDDAQAVLPALTLGGTSGSAPRDLEELLVAHGLYRREAQAMIETWRDAWFEEGTRLFYIASPTTVDSVLPLEIRPEPSAVSRVFVGRVELLTAETMDDVKSALAKRDRVGILRHKRFLDPIMARIHPTVDDESRADWQFVFDVVNAVPRGCSK